MFVASQSPATPFVVLSLVIIGVFLGLVVITIIAGKNFLDNRNDKKARQPALVALVIIGLIVLYESSGIIYDKFLR